ncbi:GNAT family N-acetyltransferase [Saccharopolyspora pogona]|uniref:GNAT family N-acetyltransferase n=1 Tax=Saccharopolyspora pogona TaxID=333966 RepID=UPI001CC23431|nr:GNAT family N-acetyltransferase [Saccharopolyspora pogona]
MGPRHRRRWCGRFQPQLPVRRHTGELAWLAADPALQGKGWGKRLLAEVLIQARAIGLEKLDLVIRSGHDLERFYEGNGWVERGRWPGTVRVAPPATTATKSGSPGTSELRCCAISMEIEGLRSNFH